MELEALDILIAIILVVGIVRGVVTGAVRQLISFLGTIVAIVLAMEVMDPVGAAAGNLLPMTESLEPVVGFITVFVAIQVVLLLAVRFIEAGVKALKLSPVNRVIGAAVGACKAALILSVLFLGLEFFDVPEEDNRDASVLYEPVASVFPVTWDYVALHLPMVRNLSDRFGKEVDRVLSDRMP
ncbi:MAG: CvpA family protein [Rhodothermales bacterium]